MYTEEEKKRNVQGTYNGPRAVSKVISIAAQVQNEFEMSRLVFDVITQIVIHFGGILNAPILENTI